MLIYLRPIKHQIYDNIKNTINVIYNINSVLKDDIILNAIPIKHNNICYILINYANMEISGLELNQLSYEIKYFIDEEIYGEIIINKTCSVHDIYIKTKPEEGNCFYDDHLNLMFIKFQDVRIEYIDITNYNFTKIFNFDIKNINFIWLNNLLEKKIASSIDNKLIYEDKFINLPQLPFLISNIDTDEHLERKKINYPITGSKAYDDKFNLVGIVSYSDMENIITLPIITIRRMLDYLNCNIMSTINLNLIPIHIVLRDEKFGFNYGLFYKKENLKNKNTKKKFSENIILSIDDYQINQEGMIIMEDTLIPISTYLWLFAKNNKVNIKNINTAFINDVRIIKSENNYILDYVDLCDLRLVNNELKLNYSFNNSLSISKLNFAKYRNKCLLELNEKIMQILKPIMQNTDIFDNLYDYIIKNKYSSKKNVVIIDDRLNIKIIRKIKSEDISDINDIISHFKTKKELGDFIESY